MWQLRSLEWTFLICSCFHQALLLKIQPRMPWRLQLRVSGAQGMETDSPCLAEVAQVRSSIRYARGTAFQSSTVRSEMNHRL